MAPIRWGPVRTCSAWTTPSSSRPTWKASRSCGATCSGARLALDRTFPERNTRILFFRLGDITVEISGGAQQTEEGIGKPDRLWGLAWGVENLKAMVARLRAANVEVSDARTGIKPGTLVATAKGAHTHGVATLLIEHTPESFRPEARAAVGAAYDNAPQRRAFTSTGLDHVAIAVSDTEAASETWRVVLGIETEARLGAPSTKSRIATLPGGETQVVLAQALREQHPVAEWIAERGEGMYAIAIKVDDIMAAVRDLQTKGVAVGEVEQGAWPGTPSRGSSARRRTASRCNSCSGSRKRNSRGELVNRGSHVTHSFLILTAYG